MQQNLQLNRTENINNVNDHQTMIHSILKNQGEQLEIQEKL